MAKRTGTGQPSAIRIWPEGLPAWFERRTTDVRHLDRAYALREFASLAEWKRRAAHVRRRVLLAAGLVPMPRRTPLRAKVFGRKRCDGYTIEKVHFESYPGFLCTGNLFRPIGLRGRVPGILNPHGHWPRGRVHHEPPSGSVPGRAIGLAKLGFVAFTYDMVGYNDSLQIPHRPDILTEQAALWGLSLMGLQLYNSMRAVDFLQALPEVDPKRIGCTGASGGGSQTFFAMAADPRITAAVPVCMVSDHMQGGCSCENGPSLRVDTTSVEIAACMAPRPLLLVSCTQDWTNHTLEHELAEIRRVYRLYGVPERVQAVRFDAPHNYNRHSCESMYAWFTRWLTGDDTVGNRITHPPFELESEQSLRVFPTGRLPAGLKKRRALVAQLRDARDAAIDAATPTTHAKLARFREAYGPSLAGALRAAVPSRDDTCVCVSQGKVPICGGQAAKLWISRRSVGDCVRATLVTPDGAAPGAPVTLVVHPGGQKGLFIGKAATPGPLVASLLKRGQCVMAIDPYLTGHQAHLADLAGTFHKMNHFHGYNASVAAQRVQDVLTAAGALVHYYRFRRVNLVACAEAGVWALLARAVWPEFARTAVDLQHAAVHDDGWWQRRAYIPLVRTAGDLRTAVALGAPAELHLFGADHFPGAWARACYRAAGQPDHLRVSQRPWDVASVARWIRGE